MNTNKAKITFFAFGFVLVFVMSVAFVLYYANKPSDYIPQENIVLDKPWHDEALALMMQKKRIINNIGVCLLYIKVAKRFGIHAKTGEYYFPQNVSLADAIRICSCGKCVTHKITIPEGFSIKQLIDRLEKNKILVGDIKTIPAEGSIMPDTYVFTHSTTKQQIIEQAQNAMNNFIDQEWPKRSKNCVLKSKQEAIILASIIEKETNCEHSEIAGVYTNRLRKGMRLQACPTVIYALTFGEKLGRSLTKKDLKLESPFNTYIRAGLTPTPICNPSRASILAVLHPATTDNLFFVFDKISKHLFSKTYAEHLRKKRILNRYN